MRIALGLILVVFVINVAVQATVATSQYDAKWCKQFVFEPDKAPKWCAVYVRAEEKRLEREAQKRRME